jgi:type I restriction enzyme, S subunit
MQKSNPIVSSEFHVIPDGWKIGTISDEGGLQYRQPQPFEGLVPYVATSDIEDGSCKPQVRVSYLERPSRADVLLRKGDIIQAKMFRTDKGFSASEEHDGWLASTGFAQFVPSKATLDGRFLFNWLTSQYFLNLKDRYCAGSTQKAIQDSSLRRLFVPVPTPNEQVKIAEVIDLAKLKVHTTKLIIRKLELIKDGLVNDLFTKGIDDVGRIRDSNQRPEEFRSSEIGAVPKTWDVCKFGEKITLQRGFDITNKEIVFGHVPVISSSGITAYNNKAMVDGPGVVTGRKGTLGKVFFTDTSFWPHDTTLWVKDFHGNEPKFVFRLMQFMHLERLDFSTANPTLNRNIVHPIVIACPSKKEQKRIVEVIDAIESRIRDEQILLEKLKLLMFGLVSDLLIGRIRVND